MCLSPGFLHTQTTLEFFPISTEASSVQMTSFQSSSPHLRYVFAQLNHAALCAALRKGFLAEICACMPKSLFSARRIVLVWTGEVRALLTVDVISERV